MALIEKVKSICKRLAPCGWHNLLLHHGLDILATDLEGELRKPLKPDRTLPGFEDFALTGDRGIEPGDPARSLLYHTLAHANVTTDAHRNPLKAYPTAAELEVVINYVYGCQPPSLQQLTEQADGKPLGVVVYAVEYRPAPDTVHKVHADLCFSRTGLSRVGTTAPLYDAKSRGFLPFVSDDAHAIRVLPARYCAYIAVQRKGDFASFGPMRFGEKDPDHDFWVPLHKLFNGSECIAGMTLDVQLQAQHKNEKLRRIHQVLGSASGWGEPDISRPPFAITNGLGDWLPERELGPGWMAAQPREKLVEVACYQGQLLSFSVPKKPELHASSLNIISDAPEYVHIRHKVDDAGNLVNLNNQPNMLEELKEGGFKALHYLDFTADGWIQAQCAALDASLPIRVNAYSLICAPDFYPLCNQRHLSEWLETLTPDIRATVFSIAPECLSDSRYPANIQSFPEHFAHTDLGITAIVSQQQPAHGSGELNVSSVASALRASCLPDAAAGVFAPGWDVGLVNYKTDGGDLKHLAAYRLGSPFPEDAKLCAALSSFWPAVAPDSAQSFEPHDGAGPTIKPMLDQEIGKGVGVAWDGTPAPKKYTEGNATHIAYQAYLYSDYTENALAGKFSLAQTGKVDSHEYQRRVDAFRRVKLSLGNAVDDWVIEAFNIASQDDWNTLHPQASLDNATADQGYRFELIRHEAAATPQYNQAHIKVMETCTYLVWPRALFRQQGSQPWQRI